MKKIFIFFVGTLLLIQIQVFADDKNSDGSHNNKWNDANNPAKFESGYEYRFYALPTSGTIETQAKGWSDSYWPKTRGSILDRWQQPSEAFHYKDYTFSKDPLHLTESQLALLSPAEKFDIIRGKFDFPFSNMLKKIDSSPGEWWKGVCNGWTTASLAFDEPKAIRFVSPVTGQVVPLASGDVKALLAYFYGVVDQTDAKTVGLSCRAGKRILFDFDGSCKDVNAGAFHIVVANELGIRKRGFAMDRDPTIEVWNQPYIGFKTTVKDQTNALSKHHSDGTAKEITVTTEVTYVDELYDTTELPLENDHHVAPNVEALGIGHQRLATDTYDYTLELDANDNIIGGKWSDPSNHPDLIWRQPIDVKLVGTPQGYKPGYGAKDDWSVLKAIVAQATAP